MFERLGNQIGEVLGRFRQRGVITEKMLDEGLRAVRRALLEADVNYKVARDFLKVVRKRSLGADLLHRSVSPGDQIVKIVHDSLVELLGGAAEPGHDEPKALPGVEAEWSAADSLAEPAVPPAVIMLVGLQGSGKTTSAAKLARRLKLGGARPAVVACDPYRPAAVGQLETLAATADVPLIAPLEDGVMDTGAVRAALHAARKEGVTHLLLDTAGRLQADEELMDELRRMKEAVAAHEVFLVADGMTGQEAVRIAEGFHAAVELTGVVLTKMDGDARGGAALSIFAVLGVPVRYVGTGERLEDLTRFDPRRMAGRILQMGDIVGLVERAQQTVDLRETERLQKKLLEQKGEFDLSDFLVSVQQIQKMGPMKGLLKMIPGIDAGMLDGADVDSRRVKHAEAIILSMTPEERRKPQILNVSRRARVARGAGRPLSEVNRLLKQFKAMKKMMKEMGKLAPMMMRGGAPPAGMLQARFPGDL